MIVRCNNCLSAFSVNDDKVVDKIFAFTCPKCNTENIINNKIKETQAYRESVLHDDIFSDSGTDSIIIDNDQPEQNEFESFQDEPSPKDDAGEDKNTERLSDDNRNINLEIEEAEIAHDIEGDDSVFEELLNDEAMNKKEDTSAFDSNEMDIPSLEDEFGIELKKDADIGKEDKDVILDDFSDSDLIVESGDSIISDDINLPTDDFSNEKSSNESKGKPAAHDDIDLDIDMSDFEIAETEPGVNKISGKSEEQIKAFSDDDLIIDLENMDIASEIESDKVHEPSVESGSIEADGDDITIDVDSLDIELEENFTDDILADNVSDDNIMKEEYKDGFDDEDIKLNLDELDIDIEEIADNKPVSDDKLISKDDLHAETDMTIDDGFDKEAVDDDDIKIDMDSLDIELEEAFTDDILADNAADGIKKEQYKDTFDDEDIKLNLDELDIDINDITDKDLAPKSNTWAEIDKSIEDEDDVKLTLDDAGLTFDELSLQEKNDDFHELSDEEIKLTLNDIDPDLTLEEIIKSAESDSKLVLDSLKELPEIYPDEYDAMSRAEDDRSLKANAAMDSMPIDDPIYDNFDYDDSEYQISSNKRSDISFYIDFTLKYSRIGACFRLLSLYILSMIPHFIVLILYSVLSSILGLINQFVILATGRCVSDFARIIENTLRYISYIETNLIGIVDDRPVYAGRKYIYHPLQFNVSFPHQYSKKMAMLRLSIIGITFVTLPHIVILTLLSLTVPICYLIGILSVIITSRWPNILFRYLTAYFRYLANVRSFMLGLTDDYPPFRLL